MRDAGQNREELFGALVRADDTVQMARFVWAVMHGVAMLGIDGQLPEAAGIDELTRYVIARRRTGIATPPASAHAGEVTASRSNGAGRSNGGRKSFTGMWVAASYSWLRNT